ncbi:benenodin family lasso peptide [Luteimonas sp. R10]|nr:benenodin family lasso peptide [Luteimonas sp. R10]
MKETNANQDRIIELGVASVETQGLNVGDETFGGEPPAGISEE